MSYKNHEKRDVTIYINREKNLSELSDKEYEKVMNVFFGDLYEDDFTQMVLEHIKDSYHWEDDEDQDLYDCVENDEKKDD